MFRVCSYSVLLLFSLSLGEVLLVLAASELHCEMLPAEECSFAVDSSGKRCVLREDNPGEYLNILSCDTSNFFVGDESPTEYIENDQCFKACGVEKLTIGFAPSPSLSDDLFLSKLCSRDCKHNCPNLIDLYTSLAKVGGGQGQGDPNTHTDLCGNWMALHKSRKSSGNVD